VKILSIEELRDALEKANGDMETADAVLQNFPSDAEEGLVSEARAEFDAAKVEVRKLGEALGRKEAMKEARDAVPGHQDAPASDRVAPVRVTNEPLTYRRMAQGGIHSFFGDLVNSKIHDNPAAAARLQRHVREMELETRAMTTGGGSGIGLVPPQYLQEDLALFARAGRPFADSLNSLPLPPVGTSLNVPRVTTGTVTAVQASEAAAVNDSSAVTDTIALSLNTVAGKVDMSRQLVERSEPSTDAVIGADLIADYAKQLDTQLLNQATNGILSLAGTNSSTVSTATAAAIYPKFADGIQLIWTNRFAQPDIMVMHPRRWAMFLGALDSANRPLVLPDAMGAVQIFNAMAANQNGNIPQGLTGLAQGLPVLIDPNVPTNFGAGTNEDRIIITKRSDALLFESETPTIALYDQVLSANLQVRILCYGYFFFTFARYPKATSIISGTGLVPPTF
jgi:HK97 family phage major capsid protein